MQQHAEQVGPENNANIRAVRKRRGREDGRFGREVEPMGEGAEEEFREGAAI